MADLSSITLPDGNVYNFKDTVARDSIPPDMVVLSYGTSTWDDFISAYNSNTIVYCRASSNSNPASGNQNRMAFMAYVNSNPPTEVEFQYYRSVSSHSATQQGDQVYIYKLNKTNGWSVTVREAMSKIAAGAGLSSSYSNGTITLSSTKTSADPATVSPLMDGTAAIGASTKYAREDHVHPSDTSKQDNLVSGTNIKTINGNSILGSGDITIGGGSGSVSITTRTATLYANGWSGAAYDWQYQNKSVSGVTATNNVIVSPASNTSTFSEWSNCKVVCVEQSNGFLRFACETKPENNLDVNIMIIDN